MSKNHTNLIVFDFCETIVSKQTANPFINYIVSRRNTLFSIAINYLEFFLTKTRFFAVIDNIYPELNFSKRLNLFKIRGLSEIDLNNAAIGFYKEFIEPNFNSEIIDILNKCSLQSDTIIVLVSGGYNPYLEIFCQNFDIQYLFSTKIECVKGKVTGFISGNDCMYHEKVKILNEFVKEGKFNFLTKTVYSDSISDLPLFKWSDIQFVISYEKSQEWASKLKYSEIVL